MVFCGNKWLGHETCPRVPRQALVILPLAILWLTIGLSILLLLHYLGWLAGGVRGRKRRVLAGFCKGKLKKRQRSRRRDEVKMDGGIASGSGCAFVGRCYDGLLFCVEGIS